MAWVTKLKAHSEAGEMAQWVKYFPLKHEDLASDPHYPHKRLDP